MTTGVLCPTPILQFFDNAGNPARNGSVLTQVGGVNAATFSDINLTVPLPNPIPLNSRGEASTQAGATAQVFLTPNTAYTFTLFDGPNGTGNQLNVATYVNGLQVSQAIIGGLLNPQTDLELAANVTPSNFAYVAYDVRRYNVPLDGTDAVAALTPVATLPLVFPTESTCVTLSNVTLSGDVIFQPGATVKPAAGTWVKFTGRVQETGQSILAAGAGGNVLLTNNPQYSYANLTLNVVASPVNPNDFSTIQAAVNSIPRYNQGHVLTINIANGTWAETPAVTNKRNNDSSPGEFLITGNTGTPSSVIVQGCIVRDCSGYLYPKFSGIQFSGGLGSTGGDECIFMALGCHRVSIANCIFDGTGLGASPPADVGVMAYAGNIDIQQLTINNCRNRTKTKHGGQVNNTQLAIQSPTGVVNSFISGGGNGLSTDIKMLGYFSGTACPLPDSTSAGKSMKQGWSYDQYTGALAGPGFFLSSTTVVEDYFTSLDGYTVANTGDGSTAIGTGGLHATVTTGLVSVTLNRATVVASPGLIRPLMFLVPVKLTTLPAGATIYVGTGWPIPGAGDFIGFKITTVAISGVVRRGGTEVATTLISGNQAGTTIRVGLFYSPETTDTNVETTPTDQAAFFSLNGNTCVYQTMSGAFTDAGSMANMFTLYCNNPGSSTDINVMGYRYVKV